MEKYSLKMLLNETFLRILLTAFQIEIGENVSINTPRSQFANLSEFTSDNLKI